MYHELECVDDPVNPDDESYRPLATETRNATSERDASVRGLVVESVLVEAWSLWAMARLCRLAWRDA